MSAIIIVGAGGHSKVVTEVIKLDDYYFRKLIYGFVDDNEGAKLFNYQHLGKIESLNELEMDNYEFICAIGNNQIRRKIVERIEGMNLGSTTNWGTYIHPSAVISPSAKIGVGTVIMANAVVNADAIIGDHCIINTGAIIEHDCVIEDYTHISPNATLCGTVYVRKGVHVGASATVIQNLLIGEWSTIGAGAVVVKDIPSGVIAKGIPAKH